MADNDQNAAVASDTLSGAASGAAAGSVIPGIGTVVGGVVGGAAGFIGGMMGSSAASQAAKAQQAQAAQWKAYVQQQESSAIGLVRSPAQLAAFDQALGAQEQNVRRQEALVSSLDPNIIEAGKQTAQLLQGHSAPVLQNLQQQRDLQKQQMMDGLRRQMGPGAENSTAGQQAIQQFDQQTANIMNGAQQQYLDKVSGMSLGGAKSLGESLSSVNSTLSQMNTESPDAQAARLMASFTGAQGAASAAEINAAGGQFAGKALAGQAITTLGSSIGKLAGFAAGSGTTPQPGTTNTAAAPAGMSTDASGFAQLTQPTLGSSFGAQGNFSLGMGSAPPGSGGGGGSNMMAAGVPSYLKAGNYGSTLGQVANPYQGPGNYVPQGAASLAGGN